MAFVLCKSQFLGVTHFESHEFLARKRNDSWIFLSTPKLVQLDIKRIPNEIQYFHSHLRPSSAQLGVQLQFQFYKYTRLKEREAQLVIEIRRARRARRVKSSDDERDIFRNFLGHSGRAPDKNSFTHPAAWTRVFSATVPRSDRETFAGAISLAHIH